MMATSNPDTIKIVREDDGGLEVYQLYVDGGQRARLTVRRQKDKPPALSLEVQFVGDFPWAESRVWVQALNRLAEVGDEVAGQGTDVKRLLHRPTDEEIDVAKKKVAAKAAKTAAKAAKKSGAKAPREQKETASSMFKELIMEGKLTDDAIFKKVQAKYGLDEGKRNYVTWYRYDLRRKGQKPPEPVEK
jgi:hypothetical protein